MKKNLLAVLLILSIGLAGCGEGNDKNTLSIDVSENNTSIEALDVSENSVSDNDEPEYPVAYLKDIYAEHGIKTGTCLSTKMTSDVNYSKLIKEQFNSVTMENDLKPDAILNQIKSKEEGKLVVEFNDSALRMLKFAKENGMLVRGHTLVWYSQTPSWIFYEDFDANKELVSREVMLDRMENYIKDVFATIDELGYTDLFYAYDVVNEAWMEDGKMRENTWKKVIGDDYIWYAFYYADKYAPESIDLYYNDYNEQMKSLTLANFVETLVDEDGRYLIDGIGLQAHLYTSDDSLKYLDAVKRLGKTGLKLSITELDVSLGAYGKTEKATEENLMKQGRYYYSLISSLLKFSDEGKINLDSITFWGFADNLSWRSTAYPLLFDFKCVPKYSFYGAALMKDYAGFNTKESN